MLFIILGEWFGY